MLPSKVTPGYREQPPFGDAGDCAGSWFFTLRTCTTFPWRIALRRISLPSFSSFVRVNCCSVIRSPRTRISCCMVCTISWYCFPLSRASTSVNHENIDVESRKGLYKIVKQRLQQTAALLRSDEKPDTATQLEATSPHWLRNTFGKSLARKGTDIRRLAGALGYANAETARAYAE